MAHTVSERKMLNNNGTLYRETSFKRTVAKRSIFIPNDDYAGNYTEKSITDIIKTGLNNKISEIKEGIKEEIKAGISVHISEIKGAISEISKSTHDIRNAKEKRQKAIKHLLDALH